MYRLRAALAACALLTTPAALGAQQATQVVVPPQPPYARTIPPHKQRPKPAPTGNARARPHHGSYGYAYPVVIDGTVVTRVLATPTPGPKTTPGRRAGNGQDVFETHSTEDAK